MKIVGVAALICGALSLAACSASSAQSGAKYVREAKYAKEGDAIAYAEPCSAISPGQQRRVDAALHVLQAFSEDEYNLYEDAMMFLGYRRGTEDRTPFCLDENLKQDITKATLAGKAWDQKLGGTAKLALARQLGPRDDRIVRNVAQTAFSTQPVPDGSFSDIRPQARSVLASFGVAGAPWREVALSSMDAETSLGTTAAQVAAASGQPAAVSAVAGLLQRELDRSKGVVERNRAKRVVELAYGLGAAGEAARPHVRVLTQLLDREVQSFAPPFGVIERTPSEVCRALSWIGGTEADRALASPKCVGQPWPYIPQ